MVNKQKHTSFKVKTMADWKLLAEKSLRNTRLEKLVTNTAENIQIHPLYTMDHQQTSLDRQTMYAHTLSRKEQNSNWIIAQQQFAKTGEQFIKQLTASLNKGNEAIVYDGEQDVKWEKGDLRKLATLIINYPVFALNLKENDDFLQVFNFIPKSSRQCVKGALSGEHIHLPTGYKELRTHAADLRLLHHNGADAVTELAIALAKAAEDSLNYTSFIEFSKRYLVIFSIDTHFFMEIAKLRAFRLLWQAFSKAYDVKKIHQIPILSENSLRSYSNLDPHVNILRASNEAFAAALGGTDILTIHPYDILTKTTELSERIARNIQLIIKHETLVTDVVDPAGGAYFIEQLTTELVEKAWKLFLHIEEKGGYEKYIESNELVERLKSLRTHRAKQLSKHERSLIGINLYADLSTSTETIAANKVNYRRAEPYEQFRTYFSSKQPSIVLLTFGKLADFKYRRDFVQSFLAAGGLKSDWSPAFATVTEANEWLQTKQYDYAVICASDHETKAVLPKFINKLPNISVIDVAGNYNDELKADWKTAGINSFIYKGQDQLEKLNEIKTFWKRGFKNEET